MSTRTRFRMALTSSDRKCLPRPLLQNVLDRSILQVRWISRAAICALVILPIVLPAYALTSQEVVAKLEAAGYSQIREMKSGKITTYKAVRAGKEVSLVIDSFGKFKELP